MHACRFRRRLGALSCPRSALFSIVSLMAFGALGCRAPNESATPPRTGGDATERAVAVVTSLPTGTRLELLPTRSVGEPGASGTPSTTAAIDALLREALRRSTRFDIAADVEHVPSAWRLAPVLDHGSGQLAIGLSDTAVPGATQPVVATTRDGRSVADWVDDLARTTRRALGERCPAEPPLAQIYSENLDSVLATERAFDRIARGRPAEAPPLVDRARSADPGNPLAWLADATARLALGDAELAATTAEKALGMLAGRLAPNTQHRLARVMLLARAMNRDAEAARRIDESLLELATTYANERPHDPHGRYSRALALAHLGRFADAAGELEVLAQRWPLVPQVSYYRSLALLATGQPALALDALTVALRVLPETTTLLPRCLALYETKATAELDDLLERMSERPTRNGTFEHELLRIRAALAILDGRDDDARAQLLADLQWLHDRPTLLESRVAALADDGVALLRLDAHAELLTRLGHFLELPVRNGTLLPTLTWLGGMAAIASGDRDSAELAIRTLAGSQEDVLAARLRAAVARAAGRIDSEASELARAQLRSDDPLDRLDLARVMMQLGRTKDADVLRSDLRASLHRHDLRAGIVHPLLSPRLAIVARALGSR
jgi:tetratricopeptide (TPR) repeat protein